MIRTLNHRFGIPLESLIGRSANALV